MPSLLSRRNFLIGTASAGAFGTGYGESRAAAGLGLGAIAASKGLLFGSLMRLSSLEAGGTYAQMMTKECTLYVCADMQWRLVAPTPDRTNFLRVDRAKTWAGAHGMRFKGHSLVWHSQTPSWFETLPDRDAAVAALQAHVRIMCTHFAGAMHSWDVVNEAIQTKGGEHGLRRSVFLKKIGPEYLDIAFRTARDSDPHALLILNEFGLENADPESRDRRDAILSLVDDFKNRNIPIDAIGLQSHLGTSFSRKLDERSLAGFLKEISDRGLKIMVTELDVVDRGSPSDVTERDAQVAALYKRYLDVVLDNTAVIAVITWALSDRDSWITRGDQAFFRRPDGLPARPLPFDDQYAPKRAYDAIVDALKAAPGR
jgi:endo-1,4-beta-xylanase